MGWALQLISDLLASVNKHHPVYSHDSLAYQGIILVVCLFSAGESSVLIDVN